MMGEKELLKAFRREAESFAPRPSERTWRHLEERLDARKRRHRVSLYRSLSMAAAVLTLIVALAALAVALDRIEDRRQLVRSAVELPKQLQDLSEAENPRAIQVMEYNRSYPPKRIEEGDPRKRLMPARQGQPL